MAVGTDNSGNSEWVKDEPEVKTEFIEFDLTKEGSPSKPIVLTKDLIMNVVGAATGVRYTWNGAGSVVDVDERDLPELLSKRGGRSCCGSIPTPYFMILEG
jgi:hypothetical protein